MRVLVTGGTGYIGSHAVARLAAAGADVVVYDDLSAGHAAALPPEARLVVGRVQDTERLAAALREHRAEAVFHFAARADVPESLALPLEYFDANVGGGLSLLQAMASCGVRHLVFSSSASVYGNPESSPIAEDAPLRPTHPYGASKHIVEQMLAGCEAACGIRAVSLRYFCATGSDGVRGEDHRPERHLIPRTLEVALGRRPHVEVCGTDYATPDGTGVRDYVFVGDVADAHLAALRYLRDGGGSVALNVGTGRGWSVREVIAAGRRVTGHPIPAIEAPRRPGDPPTLVADVARIAAVLGWRAAVAEIDGMMESAWGWMRGHPEGYGGGRR